MYTSALKKFVYEPHYWKRPANNLVATVQQRCLEILSSPEDYAVSDLEQFKERIEEYINEVKAEHSRCNPEHLTIEVSPVYDQSWQAFIIRHRNDNIAESVHFQFVSHCETYTQKNGASQLTPIDGRFGRKVTTIEQ